jgi:hypothetical protein
MDDAALIRKWFEHRGQEARAVRRRPPAIFQVNAVAIRSDASGA